ncbi:hypothetical protein [Tropheryma whipplei]|uniref:hypothetical protein n=1 Tax=Tropheryma whipplei TaxID=2039 RepID=UPI0004B99498|nr:hypothetical protein [Tropheryma whipplei]
MEISYKKLTTVSITVLSIVTLLFIAQPAQASEGNLEANQGTKLKRVTRSVKTFDVDKCLNGAVSGAVGVGGGFAGAQAAKLIIKGVSAVNPATFAAVTAGTAVADCVMHGGLVDDVVNGFNAGFNAVGDFIGKLFG